MFRFAQVTPCNNVRHLSRIGVEKDGSSCLAPGLFTVVETLQKIVQVTDSAQPVCNAVVILLCCQGIHSVGVPCARLA